MEYDVAASAFKKIRLGLPSRRTAKRIASFAVLAAVVACALLVWPGFLRGGTAYVIVSGNSMDPKLHAGDLVLTVRRGSYNVGDVVAYRIPEGQPGAGVLVIHRIVGGSERSGYIMQGDNRAGRDPWRPRRRDIVGAEGVSVPRLGLALVYLRTPLGLAALAGIVTALLILVGSGTDGSSKGAAANGGGAARPRRGGGGGGGDTVLAGSGKPLPANPLAHVRHAARSRGASPAWISRAASSTRASASVRWRIRRAGGASNSGLNPARQQQAAIRHGNLKAHAPTEGRARLTNRQRHGNAFPIALARSWGEASWTARDLRMPSSPRQEVADGAMQEALKDVRLDAVCVEPSSRRNRNGSVLKAGAKVRGAGISLKAKAVFAGILGG
jgi:signal peptidase I